MREGAAQHGEISPRVPPRALLVMGVCGVGKTSIGRALARRLGGGFVEGDDFHTEESVRRMAAGVALTDDMRIPWLRAIAEAASRDASPAVVACSALKRRYRQVLGARLPGLVVVHLTGDPKIIRQRMAARAGHFMPPAMLDSQLAELEPPGVDEALAIDIAAPPEAIVTEITKIFRRKESGDRPLPLSAAT